ncbi:hypothetical protein DPEC_G00108810 [Dallia pectoralis]|uniref:Uncharacterized protein n=1 Tax=Dallia pectoralis TaxID=75939 RepID=A0ACC2GSJ9_DALPE|nr:hypothetical protein DPEC_G00108810 [Dallia pectoralis]
MNRMQLKPDGVPGLRAFNKVQLDQASRGGSSTRTSTLPSLHNSLAASEERRRKVLPSTDALLRRYNLLPEVKPEKPKVTKPVGLKPKEERFPKTGEIRRQWELALRRDGFVAADRTLLCSEHFSSEDFDRTVQINRDGVVPTIFHFPAHLQRLVATRSTTTPRGAEDNLPVDLS